MDAFLSNSDHLFAQKRLTSCSEKYNFYVLCHKVKKIVLLLLRTNFHLWLPKLLCLNTVKRQLKRLLDSKSEKQILTDIFKERFCFSYYFSFNKSND